MPQAKLRLLFFLNSPVRAGVEEVVLALIQRLDRARFEVHLAAPQPLLDSFAPDLKGCPVQVLPIHLVSFRQWDAMKTLVRYLVGRRIHIVNSHMFYATLFAAPLARLARVPVVIETTHGPEAWRKGWWKRKYWIDRCVESLVALNISVSEADRRYLATRKCYPARKLHVVPNGRNLSCYSAVSDAQLQGLRRQFEIPERARIVAVVARLEMQKGHRYLLEALPPVVKRHPDLLVMLAGDGSLHAELDRHARALGVNKHVVFCGFQENVRLFYVLAEFLMLPSLYEGMPLTAIEAAAAGRALVATAVDGTCEVVVHGETGLLVEPRSPEALGRAMQELLDCPERAKAMGEAAGRRARELFSVERQVERTSQIYWNCGPWAGGASPIQ